MFSHLLPTVALIKRAHGTRIQSLPKVDWNRPSTQASRAMSCAAATMAVLAYLAAPPAMGQLVHRYSFTSNVSDSVGGAAFSGSVVDAGATTNAVFNAGQLDLSANTGQASNAITEDAYVNLPNGLISSTATTNGAVALEFWYTLSESHTWQRVGDFGISNGGEDMSPLGSASPYLSIVATSGRGNQVDMTNHTSTGVEPVVGFGGAATFGTPYHVMAVYDHNDHRAFVAGQPSNGTMSLYVDGALIGTGPIHPDIDIRTFTDVNNWLGRSQWPDPLFDGSYDEFRIYNRAPSDAYVAASFAAGPDTVVPFTPFAPEYDLSFTINRATGTFTLSNSVGSINVVGINITSATGALKPANWKSVTNNYDSDSGNSFDPNDTWSVSNSLATQLQEVELVGNGGQLGPGGTLSSLQLGNAGAWVLSRYEDVAVTIDRLMPDNSIQSIPVAISYTSGLGHAAARSDLNFDDSINAADWTKFAANHLASMAGKTRAETAGLGDLDGNLTQDYDDFIIFEADYDAANGPGALAVLMASVPEPSSVALMLLAAYAFAAVRRTPTARTS